jgi:hypothetical protein
VNKKIKKAGRHTNQNEGLIFEKSSPGKRAFELPPLSRRRASARSNCRRWMSRQAIRQKRLVRTTAAKV